MDFNRLIDRASSSVWSLWKLNFILKRFIPFNKPHHLKILAISKEEVKVQLPYRRSNLNHIKGLHACGLATAAEYASGLLLLYKLGIKKYRIIMESIQVEYKYQGKSSGIATYAITDMELQKEVISPLENEGVVYKECTIEVKDQDDQLLCVAKTNWQIKSWDKVKTKAN